VDTAKYQQQAETENVKQEKNNNEPIKKTEEMEKKEELKQEKDVQQPQVAETQEKPNLIADDQVNWEELRKCGIDKEKLSEKDLKALMNYGKTGLVTVKPTFGYESYELQARLSFQKMEDGYLKLTPHFIRNEPRLDIPHRGYTFTEEDKKTLKRTGNLGKPVNFANEKTGEIKPHYISIDRLTNEIVDIPADKVRIPNKIGQTNLSREEQDILRAGLPLPKEVHDFIRQAVDADVVGLDFTCLLVGEVDGLAEVARAFQRLLVLFGEGVAPVGDVKAWFIADKMGCQLQIAVLHLLERQSGLQFVTLIAEGRLYRH
jgi:hypothetical protein